MCVCVGGGGEASSSQRVPYVHGAARRDAAGADPCVVVLLGLPPLGSLFPQVKALEGLLEKLRSSGKPSSSNPLALKK